MPWLLKHLKDVLTPQTHQSQIECIIVFFPSGFPISLKLWVFDPSFCLLSVDAALSQVTDLLLCAPKDMSLVQVPTASTGPIQAPLNRALCPGCPRLPSSLLSPSTYISLFPSPPDFRNHHFCSLLLLNWLSFLFLFFFLFRFHIEMISYSI